MIGSSSSVFKLPALSRSAALLGFHSIAWAWCLDRYLPAVLLPVNGFVAQRASLANAADSN